MLLKRGEARRAANSSSHFHPRKFTPVHADVTSHKGQSGGHVVSVSSSFLWCQLTPCRQDKLILLLETGTSPQVRQTAAKQLAELTVKTLRATLTPSHEQKPDVKPEENGLTIQGQVDEDDAWAQVLEVISKVLPLLRSKSSEARYGASQALGLLAKTLPEYTPRHPIASSSTSTPIDLQALIRDGQLLLASAGREYIAKISKADKAKRKKAMMGSLGLGGGVGWGDDVDKEIGDEEDDEVELEADAKEAPSDPFEGLSARQITMLKRKKGNIVEEANK